MKGEKVALKNSSYRILPSRLVHTRGISLNNKSSLNLTYHLNKHQIIYVNFPNKNVWIFLGFTWRNNYFF